MTRLLVHVEGETEEQFVNELLAPYLRDHGYSNVSARLLGNARQRQRRGGIRPWPVVRQDIINHLRQDRQCYSTTMVDFYALPQSGVGGWPGRAEAATVHVSDKAALVERKMEEDLAAHLESAFRPDRFLPFIIMHEFEGLLFSDCAALARGIGRQELHRELQSIRDNFATPEEINDSPLTAPSKRLLSIIPNYQKPLQGTLAALEIGLPQIVKECHHFRQWLSRLLLVVEKQLTP